jgi:hypothetical protein
MTSCTNIRKLKDLIHKQCQHKAQDGEVTVPSCFYVQEVSPQFNSNFNNFDSVNPKTTIRGVHHPKYMLVCTTRGLHVVISTANYTHQGSIDTSWSQFFPINVNNNNVNSNNNNNNNNNNKRKIGEDFSEVLEDFLFHQGDQLRDTNGWKPLEFIDKFSNVKNINSHYNFDKAEVILIKYLSIIF